MITIYQRHIAELVLSQAASAKVLSGGPSVPMPLTIDQSLAQLERKVEHFEAKQAARDAETLANGPSDGPSDGPLRRPKWWTRGMLLSSVVESGGDHRRAAAKLLLGGSPLAIAAAEAYRLEMGFVAEKVSSYHDFPIASCEFLIFIERQQVGLEKLLSEYNERRELVEI
jgi:hypothetical protein